MVGYYFIMRLFRRFKGVYKIREVFCKIFVPKLKVSLGTTCTYSGIIGMITVKRSRLFKMNVFVFFFFFVIVIYIKIFIGK